MLAPTITRIHGSVNPADVSHSGSGEGGAGLCAIFYQMVIPPAEEDLSSAAFLFFRA